MEPARTLDGADAEKALSLEVCRVPSPIFSFVDQDGFDHQFTLSRQKLAAGLSPYGPLNYSINITAVDGETESQRGAQPGKQMMLC